MWGLTYSELLYVHYTTYTTYTCSYIYEYIYTYYIHTHIYIHIHTCILPCIMHTFCLIFGGKIKDAHYPWIVLILYLPSMMCIYYKFVTGTWHFFPIDIWFFKYILLIMLLQLLHFSLFIYLCPVHPFPPAFLPPFSSVHGSFI